MKRKITAAYHAATISIRTGNEEHRDKLQEALDLVISMEREVTR